MGGIAGGGISLGTLSIAIEAQVSQALSSLQQFGSEAGALMEEQKSKWGQLSDRLQSISQGMSQVGGTLSAAITAPLAGVGFAAVKVAEDLNRARTSFTTMLGSAEAADKMLKDLQAFAAKTPFEFPDLVEAARRMKAMGVEASQVLPWLTSIGNTAAALGGGKDVIDGITTALAQMSAKGKVSAEEMNQLAERGVPAWKILADQIGVSVPEAMKMAEKGAVDAATAVPAILEGMNKQFGGSMEQLSTTLTGQWSNFKDQITQALIPIGQTLIPVLQDLLTAVTPLLAAFGDFAKWFSEIPQPIQTVVITIAGLAAALGPVLLIAAQLITAFTTVAPVVSAVGAAISAAIPIIGAFVAGLSAPVIAIAAVTAALIALGVWVYNNWDTVVGVLRDAWKGIVELWDGAWSAIVGVVTGIWDTFKGGIAAYWKFITDLVGAVWNVITAIWEAEWKAIVAVVTAVWDAIEPYVKRVLDPAVEFVRDLWEGIKRAWDTIWTAIERFVTGVWEAIAGAVKTIYNPAVRFLDSLWDGIKTAWRTIWEGIETLLVGLWGRLATAATNAWGAIAKIGEFVTGIPGKLNSLADAIRGVGTEADKAAGHSPVPEFADALFDVGTNATPLPGLLAPVTGSINALGTAAGDVKPKLNFTTDFSAFTSGAATVAGSIGTVTTGLGNMGTAAGTAKTDVTTAMSNMARDVSTTIGNFAGDIIGSLWEGEGSWGEKGKSLLSSLGQTVQNAFITPATNAISGFISGAIADLLGGKGFGGILGSIKNIGKTFSGIFGGGGGKPGIPGVPGVGGGGGATGGIGGALGGITGIVGAVGGIASAISGIFGNFQMAGMNKTLDLIEKEVRYSQIHLSYILANTNDFFHRDWWKEYQNVADIRTAIVDSMEPQLARAAQHIDFLKQLGENDFKPGLNAIAANTAYLERIMTASERIAVASERSVNMNLYGTDPEIVAARIAQQLRLQGGNG